MTGDVRTGLAGSPFSLEGDALTETPGVGTLLRSTTPSVHATAARPFPHLHVQVLASFA